MSTATVLPGQKSPFPVHKHRLNRSQMEDIIRRKESVMIKGKIVSLVEHLPTEAELAADQPDDPAAQELAAANLQSQIDNLTKQLEALKNGTTKPIESAGPTPWNGLAGDPDLTPRIGPEAAASPAQPAPAAPSSDAEKDAKRQALLNSDPDATASPAPVAAPQSNGGKKAKNGDSPAAG